MRSSSAITSRMTSGICGIEPRPAGDTVALPGLGFSFRYWTDRQSRACAPGYEPAPLTGQRKTR